MIHYHYSATLYNSIGGLQYNEDVSGLIHSERTLNEEDVKKHLKEKFRCDDVRNIILNESIYIK